jgi:hypothetical protein
MDMSTLPAELQLVVFESWLQRSLLPQAARRALYDSASRHFDVPVFRKRWIQKLDPSRIDKMNTLFSKIPKPECIQKRVPDFPDLFLTTVRVYHPLDAIMPIYLFRVIQVSELNMTLFDSIHYSNFTFFDTGVTREQHHLDDNTNVWMTLML